MPNIEFRLALPTDIDAIMDMVSLAKVAMSYQNSGQWQDQYPMRSQFVSDIEKHAYHVIMLEGVIVGGVAVFDYEPDYETLLEGRWRQDGPYLVVHRLVVNPSVQGQGLGRRLLLYVEELAKQKNIMIIRLDTHDKNIPMIHIMARLGYEKIGYVLLNNFKRRAAFDKLLNR